jgi:hypothetical protein
MSTTITPLVDPVDASWRMNPSKLSVVTACVIGAPSAFRGRSPS